MQATGGAMHATTISGTGKVLVTGATGLVGSALVRRLDAEDRPVEGLGRTRDPVPRGAAWNPENGAVSPSRLEDAEAVVHLAGESIAGGRWTAAKMEEIATSRVDATRRLCEHLAGAQARPRALVCASAVGYYGDRGDELLDESSPPGEGFLADVCRAWEEAARPAREAGIRVVHLRFGMILSPEGGALAKMLPPFRMGVGGKLGSGRQFMSWISRPDAVRVIEHALADDSLEGAVNAAAPEPVRNEEFTRTLGAVLSRPTVATVPAFAARLVFGKMADELLLASARALPARLSDSGFRFEHGTLEAALRAVLERASGDATPTR